MLLRAQLCIQIPNQLSEPLVRKLIAPRVERLAHPFSAVLAVDMERAIALVEYDTPDPRPKQLTAPQVAPERVKFVISSHGVHITSRPGKSIDQFLCGALGIHPCRCTRGDHDRGVVPLYCAGPYAAAEGCQAQTRPATSRARPLR